MYKIATIITYSDINRPFIDFIIEECKKFSYQIILSQSSTYYDGSENKLYYPNDIDIVDYNHTISKLPHLKHNLSRYYAYQKLSKNVEYVLFLDADEIPEGDRFKEFLKQIDPETPSYKIANYFYFKSLRFQAIAVHDSPLLIKKDMIDIKELFGSPIERDGMTTKHNHKNPTIRLATHDNKPLIHHYSWVNSKKNILKKITTWGHKDDFNWDKILPIWENFTIDKIDPILKLNYKLVTPKWNIKI